VIKFSVVESVVESVDEVTSVDEVSGTPLAVKGQ